VTDAAKPRRWLAFPLSILWPGLGQAYAGAPLRGIAITAALHLAVIPLLQLLAVRATLTALVLTVGCGALVLLAIAVDAARIATRPRTRFLRRGSVLLACLGFIAASLPFQIALDAIQRHLPSAYYSPSGAMEPTLLIGDHVYADPRDYHPARGDVVVVSMTREPSGKLAPCHQHPDAACEGFIQRIVGLPGDRVRFDGAALYLNEERRTGDPNFEKSSDWRGASVWILPEALGTHAYRIADAADRPGPALDAVVVPPARYFLAGDNRDSAYDSRYFGTVAHADIVGRATRIYWSWHNQETWPRMLNPVVVWNLLRHETRWDRIGREIE
jgi:signal peptidase I